MASLKAFNTNDIMLRIMHFAGDASYHITEHHASLTSCTRVSRVFYTQSTRLLWKRLENLDPILRLLPSDALYGQRQNGRISTQLSRPLTVLEWNLVMRYASLVNEIFPIHRCGTSMNVVSVEWCNALLHEAAEQGISLFPHLRLLGQPPPAFNITTLLQNSLSHLYIGDCYHSQMTLAYPKNVMDRVKVLENLEVIWIGNGANQALRETLLSKPNLKELVIEDTDFLHFSLLQSIQTFCNLGVLAFSTNELFFDRPTYIKLAFPRLQILRVTGDIKQIGDLLLVTGIRPQSKLQLFPSVLSCSSEDAVLNQLDELVIAIAKVTGKTLRNLEINLQGAGTHQVLGHNSLENFILAPILDFKKLTVLILDTQIPFVFQESDIQTVFESFPEIEELDLGGSIRNVHFHKSRLSPTCLVDAAVKCPNLRRLSIFISPNWHEMEDSVNRLVSTSQVEVLCLGPSKLAVNDFGSRMPPRRCDVHALFDSQIDRDAPQSSEIARILLVLFPRLKVFDSFCSDLKEVTRLLFHPTNKSNGECDEYSDSELLVSVSSDQWSESD